MSSNGRRLEVPECLQDQGNSIGHGFGIGQMFRALAREAGDYAFAVAIMRCPLGASDRA